MYLSPLKVWVGIKEHALLSERENMPPKKRKMVPEHLVQQWNETMQDVHHVTDSEEESVPDTQAPEPFSFLGLLPFSPPPAKKPKTHQTHHV